MSDNSAVLLKRSKEFRRSAKDKAINARENNLSRISESSKSSVNILNRNMVTSSTDSNHFYKTKKDTVTGVIKKQSKHARIKEMENDLLKLKALSGKLIKYDKICEQEVPFKEDWYKPKLPAIVKTTCPPPNNFHKPIKPKINKKETLPKIKTFDTTKQQKQIEVLKRKLKC